MNTAIKVSLSHFSGDPYIFIALPSLLELVDKSRIVYGYVDYKKMQQVKTKNSKTPSLLLTEFLFVDHTENLSLY